jgi:putative endonuclease
MAEHNDLGRKGEALAQGFLEDLKFKIVATNWRERKYEIDVVAIDQEDLVFIEVKSRSTERFGSPLEAINSKKQRQLVDGADFFIQKYELDFNSRFDVISVVFDKSNASIQHVIGAFHPSDVN